MTRINVVPVEELSDQHLIAEYRELPRVIKQNIDTFDAPDEYCLGDAHMKWARKHWMFTLNRYEAIIKEMKHRGFAVKYSYKKLYQDYIGTFPLGEIYHVAQSAIELNRNRLIEKYRMKPDWYRWTKREKPSYYEGEIK